MSPSEMSSKSRVTYGRWSVDWLLNLGVCYQVHNGNEERHAISDEDVAELEGLEALGSVAVEEGDVDIPGHAGRPERVGGDEAGDVRVGVGEGDGDSRLNEEALRTTGGRGLAIGARKQHRGGEQGGGVGEDVAERGQEDEAINGLVEALEGGEGDDDEDRAEEGQHRACALGNDDAVHGVVGEGRGRHGGGRQASLVEWNSRAGQRPRMVGGSTREGCRERQ